MIKLCMENMYDGVVSLLHYIIPNVSKDEYLEIKEAAKDMGIHLDSIDYDGRVVKITFSKYDRKTHEKCYNLYNMFIGDRGLTAESFDESIAPDTETLEPLKTLVYQMKNNLAKLSSIYANADETSSRIKWTDVMKNKYESAYEEALTALQKLRSCIEYMKEFEGESESNY